MNEWNVGDKAIYNDGTTKWKVTIMQIDNLPAGQIGIQEDTTQAFGLVETTKLSKP